VKNFKCQIITQEGVTFDDDVEMITLPTQDGEITILSEHMPLISLINPGEVVIQKNKENIYLAVTGGFLEVLPDKTVVLADSADRFDELDEKKALEAREKAEKMMQEKLTERETAEAQASLQKALLHVKILHKKKTTHRTLKLNNKEQI